MAVHRNEHFRDRQINVDGHVFIDCSFERGLWIYSGGELPRFEGCRSNGTGVELRGAALRTTNYLEMMASLAGPEGRGFLRGVFPILEKPPPPAVPRVVSGIKVTNSADLDFSSIRVEGAMHAMTIDSSERVRAKDVEHNVSRLPSAPPAAARSPWWNRALSYAGDHVVKTIVAIVSTVVAAYLVIEFGLKR
jgi:hypothetical protein